MPLVIILFLLFLLVSTVKKKSRKWMYLPLSLLSIFGVIFLFACSPFDTKEVEQPEKKIEVPSENPINKEKVPDENKLETPNNKEKVTPDENKQENPQIQPEEKTPDSEANTDQDPIQQPSEPETNPTTPEKILVPNKGTVNYTVVAGDTLWSIATQAEVTVEKLKQWNNLASDTIQVGQIIKIYGKDNEPAAQINPPKEEPTPVNTPSVLISNGSSKQKQITLTFDAGSDAVGIRILDILEKHHVKATFFLTGKWVEKFPSYARRIVNDGHEIGNHTYSHPDAVTISSSAFKSDIEKAETIIKKTTGQSPHPYFRFPYGSYNTTSLQAVGEAGYPYSIQWSLDTIDWKQPSIDVIADRIKTGASNGDIILMHIGSQNTPEAVDQVIPLLKAKGYQLVTLSELLQ